MVEVPVDQVCKIGNKSLNILLEQVGEVAVCKIFGQERDSEKFLESEEYFGVGEDSGEDN